MNPEAELIALRTMCRAAAAEIREHWEAHCNEEGYGPCNLLARLAGDIPPDLYPGHATSEEIDEYGRLVRRESSYVQCLHDHNYGQNLRGAYKC
jgi:hypothetical protein